MCKLVQHNPKGDCTERL